ncbi:hypothetical protein [Costertonia aggregata]|uniref:Uncharacterized protein n=1 Tax=Costertonia aggregata TaxID=343403 RepID=A0A7H9AU77_9FLAO|nr:hypothetical protein [Costertonia aggregata]QLG46862.1 hypothetical protein HYG79_16380 [Costertonia aggregata]
MDTNTLESWHVLGLGFFILYIHYIFLFIKKYKDYINEFSYLTKVQRRKGTYLLFLYLLMSLVLFASPIYFGTMERDNIRAEQMKKERTSLCDSYGTAKCILVDNGNIQDYIFFEFHVNGTKVKGATAIEKD